MTVPPGRKFAYSTRLPGGGQDVGQVDVPLVGRPVRDLDRQAVPEGDPEKLGLPARHLAVQLGVAEQRGSHAAFANLRGFALGLQASFTHETVAA